MALKDVLLDAWSALSHKQPLADQTALRVNGWEQRGWLPEDARRRLAAYMVCAAYESNTARVFLDTDDEDDRASRREYGDAALVVDQTLAHLLGDTLSVVVPGAEDYDPDLDVDPDGDGESDVDPERVAANTAASRLAALQEHLQEWSRDVHLELRVTDSERNAVLYGDGVYLMTWDSRARRPVPVVMDPGFYFPVLPDSLDAYAYPERVHFAWELPGEDFFDGKRRLRRITYALGAIRQPFDPDTFEDLPLPPGDRLVSTTIGEGEAAFTETTVVRDYPWGESDQTCYVTDATWVLDDLKGDWTIDTLSPENADYRFDGDGNRLADFDLGIDFLPVVHVPNTPPGGDHFGQSSLARIAQVLDDLQSADTDSQAASATTGSPIIGVHGAKVGVDPISGRGKRLVVGAGEVWDLGADGGFDTLQTGDNLRAMREYVDQLLDRLSTNSRLPAAVLGMVDASEVPSGYAMQLSFGPLDAMVRQMRLVRGVKYPLLLKFAVRMMILNGTLPEDARTDDPPRVELQFGAYLPSDRQGTLDMVVTGVSKGVLSLETAVAMLVEVGFPVDDAAEEVRRIQSRSFEAANQLADATGDNAAVRSYLDLPDADQGEVQPVQITTTPGGVPLIPTPGGNPPA